MIEYCASTAYNRLSFSRSASVSALRRRATELLEQEEAVDFFRPRSHAPRISADSARKSSADVGTVHHRFLEHVSFERLNSAAELRAEAERMVGEGILASEELDWLNFNSLLKFWQSDVGKRVQSNRQNVRRELAFTARFSPKELFANSATAKKMEGEFVVVQGVADLVVMLPYLSAYMGHADLRGTQYYLQLTADAHPEVAAMVTARFGYVIPDPAGPPQGARQ